MEPTASMNDVLDFLSLHPEHRAVQIELEMIRGIARYLYPTWKAKLLAVTGIRKPEGLSRANFLQEQLQVNIAREASLDLLRTLNEQRAFAIYLRPFRTEDVLSDPAWEDTSTGLRFQRSVELSTVRRFGQFPVYGLFNALNIVDGGYRPVWVPSKRDIDWQRPLLALCHFAKIVVIDGTGSGPGLEWELDEITSRFADKVWLIAGQSPSGDWISKSVCMAVGHLPDDHVTAAHVDNDVRYSEEIPEWVKSKLSANVNAEHSSS